jgi:hypothetical protein
MPLFIAKFIEEFEAGRVTEAIVLTNNSTDTKWFMCAQAACAGVCFTSGRIRFIDDRGGEVFPTQGQAFFYFGSNYERFREVFRDVGFVMRPDTGGPETVRLSPPERKLSLEARSPVGYDNSDEHGQCSTVGCLKEQAWAERRGREARPGATRSRKGQLANVTTVAVPRHV